LESIHTYNNCMDCYFGWGDAITVIFIKHVPAQFVVSLRPEK